MSAWELGKHLKSGPDDWPNNSFVYFAVLAGLTPD